MTALPLDYSERAYAAVLGKLIGVYLGRPFEGWTYQRIMRELGPIEGYVHERLNCPLVVTDDDVAGTFTFIRALEDHGARADLTSREIGETWLNYLGLANIPFDASRALELRFARLGLEPAVVMTPTFTSPEVTRMRTYELMATPLIYSGQTARARVIANSRNVGDVAVSLSVLVYRRADALEAVESEGVALAPGEETVLDWRLPDTDGQPIQSIGIAARSLGSAQDGAIVLDWLRWDGPPDVRLRRPREPSDFWRRAWVNAVDNFSTTSPQAFRISQDRGEGMIIHGSRQWRDYRVETALTVHLAEQAGIGVRVQGLRRFYAVLLVRSNVLRLVRARDGETTVLAETPFEWSFERSYHFILATEGQTIEVTVDGVRLAARDESEGAIANGGVALIIEGGAASSDEILVAPHSCPR